MKRRALMSVSDKSGILEFARELVKMDVEILSTGGTRKHLEDNGVPTTAVDEVTGFANSFQMFICNFFSWV